MRNQWIEHFDLYPHKAQYRPNEEIRLIIEMEGNITKAGEAIISIKKGHEEIKEIRFSLADPTLFKDSHYNIPVSIDSDQEWSCYGVDVKIINQDREVVAERSSAFDIADHWRRAPRYGFLSDFYEEELGNTKDVESLNKFHLNIVQFYDWMYRHDQLIPDEDTFIDPMGRKLSYAVVQEKIKTLKEKGISSIAYGAVYASLKDFVERHPEWALYKRNGDLFDLIKIFYIMDISKDSKWKDHIISEFAKAIEAGFDGIHMDQYGFPKWAYRINEGEKKLVDLANDYPRLINEAKVKLIKINPNVGLIFNNVSNYPVHKTAIANQEAIYIEVWAPIESYDELKSRIMRARELGQGKSVILAAYLPPFNKKSDASPDSAENGALLTMATIFSNGGYHLLLGEDHKVLTAAYYADYGNMRPKFIEEVRRYYDFIVRYGEWLYSNKLNDVSYELFGGENLDIVFRGKVPFIPNEKPGTVWVQVKQLEHHLFIHLINLVGIEDDTWFTPKQNRPEKQHDILCRVKVLPHVNGIYLLTPDEVTTEPKSLNYQWKEEDGDSVLEFVIPELNIWSVIHIEF